jgi:hypothetical protein
MEDFARRIVASIVIIGTHRSANSPSVIPEVVCQNGECASCLGDRRCLFPLTATTTACDRTGFAFIAFVTDVAMMSAIL